MYNQVQGTYPQLAGSFHNAQGMLPHDNGRTAQQVPTFMGGVQGMINASSSANQFQGIPLGQSILGYQNIASNNYRENYIRTMNSVVGGVGTGTSLLTLGAGIAGMAGYGGAAGALIGGPLGILGGIGIGGVVGGYKSKMQDVADMRQLAMQGNFGGRLTDPLTGQLSHTAAFDMASGLRSSAKGIGVKFSEMKNLTGMASNMGMLSGTNSISEVTRKITDLAKASKEIMMLGEGISMGDAMQLQKLTQDMGISTAKFQGMGLGKNLVTAARAARMSTQQAAQLGGQGAATYSQMGLGAASGMNAAFYSSTAAQALVASGALSQKDLTAVGGKQGLGQSLMGGQASTLGRLSDTLVMGAVKMDDDGSMRIDRELLDQYTRGQVTRKDLVERGRNIGSGLSKHDRNTLLEQLHYQMPELKQEMSDSLRSEEVMQIQSNEIESLQKRTGMSYRRAVDSYFQNPQQAKAFIHYAKNFRQVRAETRKQGRLSSQEEMLRYAGMAKSNTMLDRFGRATTDTLAGVVDSAMDRFTKMGEVLAMDVLGTANIRQRGVNRMMGYQEEATGPDYLISSKRLLQRGDRRGRRSTGESAFSNYTDAVKGLGTEDFMNQFGGGDELFFLGGGGLAQRMEEATSGQQNVLTKLLRGHYLGFEGSLFKSDEYHKEVVRKQARLTDEATIAGNLMGEKRNFNITNSKQRAKYTKALRRLRDLGTRRAKGEIVNIDRLTPGVLALEVGLDLDNKEDRAALGAAMDYAMTKDTGESRKGIAELSRTMQGLTGLSALGGLGAEQREKDTLDIGGGTLTAEGLDRAIYQSNIGSEDLGSLLEVINTAGNVVMPGSRQFNTRQILGMAGIQTDNVDMRHAKQLIQTLGKGMVTSGGKTVGIKEATNLQNIAIAGSALGRVKNSEEQDQIDAMNAEIEANLGRGGKNLVSAITAAMEDPEQAARRTALGKIAISGQKEEVKELKKLLTSDIAIGEDNSIIKEFLMSKGGTLKDGFRFRAITPELMSRARNRETARRAFLAKKRRKGTATSKEIEELELLHTGADPRSVDYQRVMRKFMLQAGGDIARENKNRRLDNPSEADKQKVDEMLEDQEFGEGFFDSNTGLSGILDSLKGTGDSAVSKEAIEKLKASPEFARIQSQYDRSRAAVAVDPQQAAQQKQKLLGQIIATSRGMSSKNKQNGEADQLKSSLDKISTGLDAFNTKLEQIKVQAAKDSVINIQLTADN